MSSRFYSLSPSNESNESESLELKKERSAKYWSKDEFFAPDTVVLGLDIGMEGIGICIRKGAKIVYCKTLLVDLPESQALANRCAFRASRHVKKNRRLRMRRLKELMEKHGLPWVNDDIMSRSDPYELRHRAIAKKLASREALSICIRSLVAHRGYDYDALKELGSYPWGSSSALKDVKSWLNTTYVNQDIFDLIQDSMEELTEGKGLPLEESSRNELIDLLERRRSESEKQDINAMVAGYCKQKISERRARGMNYPRVVVKKHLKTILDKHAHLIDDSEGFQKALFHPCKNAVDKEKAIFYYQRKSAPECAAHFQKKIRDCPLSKWLNLHPETSKCCPKSNPSVRLWSLVDFLSTRRFYLKPKTEKTSKKRDTPSSSEETRLEKRLLPASAIQEILTQAVPKDTGDFAKWSTVKGALTGALAQEGLVMPDGKDKTISADQKEWNKNQLDALKDLASPNASSSKTNASLCEASAQKLYELVTLNGTVFDPILMEEEKKASGLYEHRQTITSFGGTYPQVSALLGTIGPDKKKQTSQKTKGLLHRIFADIAHILGGKTTPDYVVVECIRNSAKTKDQKKEIAKEQKNSRAAKDKLGAAYQITGHLSKSRYYRISLWKQQGGNSENPARCPFTGKDLPVDGPLSDSLELAHLYPDAKGGLYIMDNLVLTHRDTNKAMGNRTPVEAARNGIFGINCEEMLKNAEKFDWSPAKKTLFSFENSSDTPFPDFNNMTRISQLASQLRKQVAFWLGIHADSGEMLAGEAQRTRIGSPQASVSYTDCGVRVQAWFAT